MSVVFPKILSRGHPSQGKVQGSPRCPNFLSLPVGWMLPTTPSFASSVSGPSGSAAPLLPLPLGVGVPLFTPSVLSLRLPSLLSWFPAGSSTMVILQWVFPELLHLICFFHSVLKIRHKTVIITSERRFFRIYSPFYPTSINLHYSVSFPVLADNLVEMFASLLFLLLCHKTFINIFTAYYIIFCQSLLHRSIKHMSHSLDKHRCIVAHEGTRGYSWGSILVTHGVLGRDASDNVNVWAAFS